MLGADRRRPRSRSARRAAEKATIHQTRPGRGSVPPQRSERGRQSRSRRRCGRRGSSRAPRARAPACALATSPTPKHARRAMRVAATGAGGCRSRVPRSVTTRPRSAITPRQTATPTVSCSPSAIDEQRRHRALGRGDRRDHAHLADPQRPVHHREPDGRADAGRDRPRPGRAGDAVGDAGDRGERDGERASRSASPMPAPAGIRGPSSSATRRRSRGPSMTAAVSPPRIGIIAK